MSTALATRDPKSGMNSWQDEPDYDDEHFKPVHELKTQYLDYLGNKVQEYEEQKIARRYYHGAQYTADQIKILRRRHQPIVTFNRINRKVDSIVSLAQRLRQEPKAYPRTPKSDSGAEIATQSIRTVLDGAGWKNLDFMSCRQAGIDGIGGIQLRLEDGDHDDPDVTGDIVFIDDYFYDFHSYDPSFRDIGYEGVGKWLDADTVIEMFDHIEGIEDLVESLIGAGSDLTTNSDREVKWVQSQQRRLRLVEHWYKNRGKWYWAFYCADQMIEEGVSPFFDERKKTMSGFVMFSAAVDHDGDRYGFVRNLQGPQDEINQRRSKALHISNVTRVTIVKGAVDDIETYRREAARPDGVKEINPGFADQVKDDDQTADLAAQLQLMQDARQEIDSFANINPALMAQPDTPDEHSGVAINLLQKAGIAEIGSFLLAYRDWKIRVYRKVWNIVVRTWKSERFIRVSDDQGVTSFLQINGTEIGEWGQPVLVNNLGALDVEILLDEGPDEINLMHDSLMTLNSMGPGFKDQFPELVIELSPLQGSVKKKMIDKINQAKSQPPPPDPKAQVQLQVEQLKANAAAKTSDQQLQIAQVRGQAEMANAQQDQQQTQLERAIANEKAQAEIARIRLEAQAAEREHAYKMAELEAAARDKAAQRADAARQRKAKPVRKAA